MASTLAFPHHGGNPGSKNPEEFTESICNAVRPENIVFSIRDNVHHYPTKEVANTVASKFPDIKMYSTRSSKVISDLAAQSPDNYHGGSKAVGHVKELFC